MKYIPWQATNKNYNVIRTPTLSDIQAPNVNKNAVLHNEDLNLTQKLQIRFANIFQTKAPTNYAIGKLNIITPTIPGSKQ